MPEPARLERERLFERIEMVRGRGDHRRHQFCVMSLVALLAGERHTDAPRTASPFLCCFVPIVNDGLCDAGRQRLKLFAPRIVGTHDGLDRERAALVLRAIADEVAPQLRRDALLPVATAPDYGDRAGTAGGSTAEIHRSLSRRAEARTWLEVSQVATQAARLLVAAADSDLPGVDGRWYGDKAIELVDRLCDIGRADICAGAEQERFRQALDLLERRTPLAIAATFLATGTARMRRRLLRQAPIATPTSASCPRPRAVRAVHLEEAPENQPVGPSMG